MKPIIKICGLLFITGFVCLVPTCAVSAPDSSEIVCDGKLMRMAIIQVPIATMFNELQTECGIQFDGLVDDQDRQVSFSQSGNRQDVIRSLLQTLDMNNYALEYRDDLLVQVTVLPVSTSPDAERPNSVSPPPEISENPFADGLRIIDVIEGSQAALANLQEEDLILYYDGHRVTQPAELVRLSQERDVQEPVELVLIRDGDPVRVFLNGGFIGIRIRTGLIERSILEKYLDIMK